jgi:predicted SnoaL-like aldol condensation-catalyzing enzyme
MSIADNIQTMQAFLGYFNPAEAKRMAQGCGTRLADDGETIKVDHTSAPKDHQAAKRRPDMAIADNIQTMQAFLGHFNPAQAERMAQGGGARLADDGETIKVDHVSTPKDGVADEQLLRSLSALQDALPDLDVAIEDTIAEGDKVAVRFAVTSHRAGDDRASAPGILICRVAEGKIVEHWMQPDVPALLQMMGAVPTPALT